MGFSANTELAVCSAANYEYTNACREWGDAFASLHEGWAVLKEEVDEATAPAVALDATLSELWDAVRRGDKVSVSRLALSMQETAMAAMMELAQVWAVCQKLRSTSRGPA